MLADHHLLGLLTKKFLNLLKGAPGGMVDLNNAAETLEVGSLLLLFQEIRSSVSHVNVLPLCRYKKDVYMTLLLSSKG